MILLIHRLTISDNKYFGSTIANLPCIFMPLDFLLEYACIDENDNHSLT